MIRVAGYLETNMCDCRRILFAMLPLLEPQQNTRFPKEAKAAPSSGETQAKASNTLQNQHMSLAQKGRRSCDILQNTPETVDTRETTLYGSNAIAHTMVKTQVFRPVMNDLTGSTAFILVGRYNGIATEILLVWQMIAFF